MSLLCYKYPHLIHIHPSIFFIYKTGLFSPYNLCPRHVSLLSLPLRFLEVPNLKFIITTSFLSLDVTLTVEDGYASSLPLLSPTRSHRGGIAREARGLGGGVYLAVTCEYLVLFDGIEISILDYFNAELMRLP